MNDWLWLVPGGALSGALVIALAGGRMRSAFIAWLACAAAAISFASVLVLWFGGAAAHGLHQTLYVWAPVGQWQPTFGLTLDRTALVMAGIVTGVGLLIHLYSVSFMAGESGQRRYYFFMNLFLSGMLVLVLADNLLLLYLGWEMVGLCSYALIGFWYQNPVNATAGRKAFIVTRIGDTSLAIGIFLLFSELHTLSFDSLFSAAVNQWAVGSGLATLAAVLILGGALGKSAQLPLQVWLPDAMAGPSPVSALIHAATMVTAGVYLLIRIHPLLELAPQVQWLVAAIGAVTILYGATSALAQHDIKRVLAYSTISQIGYMFLAVGCGAYALALFHLTIHAFFKALLFLAAGAVIHAFDGEHDIRRMGGLAKHIPLLHYCFLAGAASLAAMPVVTAGFFSKDAILTAAWAAPAGPLLWAFAVTGALLTGAYIFRVYLFVFPGTGPAPALATLSGAMAIPLVVLALCSIGAGFIEWPDGWPGAHLWSNWLATDLGRAVMPTHATAYMLQFAGAACAIGGIVLAFPLVRRERRGAMPLIMQFLATGWGFDVFYTIVFVRPYRMLANGVRRWIDEAAVEGGVTALGKGFVGFARFNRRNVEFAAIEGALGELVAGLRRGHQMLSTTQNGVLSRYATAIAAGAVLILGYCLWAVGG